MDSMSDIIKRHLNTSWRIERSASNNDIKLCYKFNSTSAEDMELEIIRLIHTTGIYENLKKSYYELYEYKAFYDKYIKVLESGSK